MAAKDIAFAAIKAGISIIPPREDGSKAPDASSWISYQKRIADEQEVQDWYVNGRTGLGVVCGHVSGDLEMLEVEGRAIAEGIWDRFKLAAEDRGLASLLNRVADSYLERSPNGGYHLFWRCVDGIEGNQKLARRPATPEELTAAQREEFTEAKNVGRRPRTLRPEDRPQVLFETRGEGGYVVVAPSNGKVHPTGGAYTALRGSLVDVASVTGEERESLFELTRMFDQMPRTEYEPPRGQRPLKNDARAGDDFNTRGDWHEILEPAGWTFLFRAQDGNQHWCRPGRTGVTSATISPDEQWFYVFSSSTVFEVGKGYTKFATFAILEHNGEFKAAADALREAGYGEPKRKPRIGGSGELPDLPAEGGEGDRPLRLVREESDPPIYSMWFAENRVLRGLTPAKLKDWGAIDTAWLAQQKGWLLWRPSKAELWLGGSGLLRTLIEACEYVQPPPELTLRGRVLAHLLRLYGSEPPDDPADPRADPAQIERGEAWWDLETGFVYFSLAAFQKNVWQHENPGDRLSRPQLKQAIEDLGGYVGERRDLVGGRVDRKQKRVTRVPWTVLTEADT